LAADLPTEPQPESALIPWQQRLFDDVFLLLMAGLVVPTLFYTVWGLFELSNIPFLP
jgi:hypothetical protein